MYEGCIGKISYSFPNETISNELHDENNENARHKKSLRVTPLNTAAYHTYDQVGESIDGSVAYQIEIYAHNKA